MPVAVDEVTQLVRGTVTIGTVTSHNVDIPRLLADFHADHPNVEITLATDSSDNLIENVRAGRLDVAIVSVGPDEVPDGLDVEVVTDEAIEAAVCRTDPLAKRKKIRLADLCDRTLIALPGRRRHPASVRPCLRAGGCHTADRVRGEHPAGVGRAGRARPRCRDRARVGAARPCRPARAEVRPGAAGAVGAGMAVRGPDQPGCAGPDRSGSAATACQRPCIE